MDETEGGPAPPRTVTAAQRLSAGSPVDRPRVIRETVAMTLRSQLTAQCPHRACSTRSMPDLQRRDAKGRGAAVSCEEGVQGPSSGVEFASVCAPVR